MDIYKLLGIIGGVFIFQKLFLFLLYHFFNGYEDEFGVVNAVNSNTLSINNRLESQRQNTNNRFKDEINRQYNENLQREQYQNRDIQRLQSEQHRQTQQQFQKNLVSQSIKSVMPFDKGGFIKNPSVNPTDRNFQQSNRNDLNNLNNSMTRNQEQMQTHNLNHNNNQANDNFHNNFNN